MNKEKLKPHLCAFVIFTGCLTTAVLLLVKFRPENKTAYDTQILSSTGINSNNLVTNNNPTGIQTNDSLSYWARDAPLVRNRSDHEAVLLANGKVMVAGGVSDPAIIIQICEFYSSSVGWQSGSTMRNPRYLHTLTLFSNATKALAAGSAVSAYQKTAEVYDSAADKWSLTSANMTTGRCLHTAVLLNNEQILIMGGKDSSGFTLSSAELFNPSSNTFTKIGNMKISRFLFTSTLLNDGSTVLVAGGGDILNIIIGIAELYTSGSWVFTANPMTQPRAFHAAVLLKDGNVLIAGGGNGASNSYSTAEIYNSTTRTFRPVGSMKYRRGSFTLTLLPSGQVLATGGVDWTTDTYPTTCELYDPITQLWSNTRILHNSRQNHRTVLFNGSILTIGGFNSGNDLTATCEKYNL